MFHVVPSLSSDSFKKLTENAGEAFLDSLLGADATYEIPYFQRPYKWAKQKLVEFQNDILRLLDDGGDTESHFLGAVIIQVADRTARPTLARKYQVIDGQQRITTTMLYLLAAVDVLLESGGDEELNHAAALFRKYLVVTSDTDGKSNFKLHSCGEDRRAMNAVMSSVYENNRLKDRLNPFRLIQLETGQGPTSSRVKTNYKSAKSFMRSHYESGGLAHLENIYVALLLGVTVVQIVVNNPLSGPKIFHSLNSKQEPMTVGELVRNDVFARQATTNDANIEDLYRDIWNPFYEAFGPPEKKFFDGYFFPYGLISLSPNIKKSAVYPELRELWTNNQLSPGEIVAELGRFQPDYLDFLIDGNRAEHSTELADAITRLRDFGLPTSIFSFLIRISYEVRQGSLPSTVGVKLFKSIESFLVRRGVFGLEPSGLHAAFKGMWNDLEQRRIADRGQIDDYPRYLKESVSARTTVQWPSDEEFRESIRNRSLYGSLVTPFILREYDRFLGNDGVDYGDAEIEHVLPQAPHQRWFEDFTSEQHKTLVGRLGNLTLLTPRMNNTLSNNPFELKHQEYLEESRYRMTRKLASDYGVWKPESIAERGELFADWAVQRWPE
jgi:hypothetical protein